MHPESGTPAPFHFSAIYEAQASVELVCSKDFTVALGILWTHLSHHPEYGTASYIAFHVEEIVMQVRA